MTRMLWGAVQLTLMRPSFHSFYGWRRFLLRLFGADIDSTAIVRRTVSIECPWNLTMGPNSCLGDHVIAYCLGPITIGSRTTVSQNAHLCAGTHDYTRADLPLIKATIVLEDDVWIAADAYVGPGVTVKQGALLGARGCAHKDLEPWTIYGGNPAVKLKERSYDG